MLVRSERWKAIYPGAHIGILAMHGVANPESSPALAARAQALEAELRAAYAGFTRDQLRSLPLLAPYAAHYKRWDQTYHVQHQLESVALKGKPIARGSAIVEAMFMAELKNLLLTAVHDLDAVQGEVAVDAADGSESYLTLGGKEQGLKPGDMFIRDAAGILSSILYGPDQRTRTTPETTSVLFTVYAPEGIPGAKVPDHLADLEAFTRAISPAAAVGHTEVVAAFSEGD
jgi:DNA/RNA-binding domain of Phe-tRNA-synthetase-like protein